MLYVTPHKALKWSIVGSIVVTLAILSIIAYGAYISGGYVRFPDVFKAVGCSLLSFNGKYFTRVAITFDSSLLRYHGKKLFGFVQVAVASPYGIYTWNYWLNSTKTICIDLSNAIRDFEKFYEELKKSGEYGKTDLSLLTIWITFYMYDNEGHMYLASYSYSSYDYLMRKGLSLDEITSKLLQDPLIMFRQPQWLVITGKDIKYTNITLQFKYAMNYLTKELYGKTVYEKLESFKAPSKDVVELVMYRFADFPWCRPKLLEVYWDELYNNRYNPPDGWMKHILGDLDSHKKYLWKVFASIFSLAYLYPKDEYSLQDVLFCMSHGIGPQGAGTMHQLFIILQQNSPAPAWKNTIKPGTKIHIEGTIGVEMYFKIKAPLEASLSVSKTGEKSYECGITFLGHIIFGYQEFNLEGEQAQRTIYYSNKYHIAYLKVPMTIEYEGDGYSLSYYVDTVYYNGTWYWVAIPLISFVPLYKIVDMKISNRNWIGHEPESILSNLTYWNSTKYVLVLRELVPAGTPAWTIFYEDSNTASWINKDDLGYWISDFVVPMLKLVICYVVGSVTGPLGSLFIRIATVFFSFTYTNTKKTLLGMDFYVDTSNDVKKEFVLEIYKLEPAGQEPIYINGHGYLPVMMQYIVIAEPYIPNAPTPYTLNRTELLHIISRCK